MYSGRGVYPGAMVNNVGIFFRLPLNLNLTQLSVGLTVSGRRQCERAAVNNAECTSLDLPLA